MHLEAEKKLVHLMNICLPQLYLCGEFLACMLHECNMDEFCWSRELDQIWNYYLNGGSVDKFGPSNDFSFF